ncbi:hypothetical protein [Geminicoccus harenae]|uniref:hypothetical protein n=1 Tax=Geminicoccus harenae TaxID=2498453 RepID=UPI001C946C42|nr:hypothetical protein [Geminicoccus harenae]
MIKKLCDLEMVPAVFWYLYNLGQGRQPDRALPQLELFRWTSAGGSTQAALSGQ